MKAELRELDDAVRFNTNTETQNYINAETGFFYKIEGEYFMSEVLNLG